MSSSTSPHYLNILPSSTLPFTYTPKKFLTSSIKLSNPTSFPIAFKIRTNAPFNYLVKPRQGLILPQQAAIIDVTMQPSDIDPEKTSLTDKFLINACPVEGSTQLGQVDINSVFLKAKQDIVQTEKLKVGFLVESESCVETRDTSMCENSPVKEIKEAKENKDNKEIERQESETSELNGSFCGPLEPIEETIRGNLNMMKRFVSEMEIQPRKKLELNEKVHSEKVILGEQRREEQIMKTDDETKVWIEKIMEHKDKLKKHLEEIKKLNCVNHMQKFAEGWNVKGDHKWRILVIVVVFLFLGTVLR